MALEFYSFESFYGTKLSFVSQMTHSCSKIFHHARIPLCVCVCLCGCVIGLWVGTQHSRVIIKAFFPRYTPSSVANDHSGGCGSFSRLCPHDTLQKSSMRIKLWRKSETFHADSHTQLFLFSPNQSGCFSQVSELAWRLKSDPDKEEKLQLQAACSWHCCLLWISYDTSCAAADR